MPSQQLNVPHKTSLPEGVRVGTVMRIRGVVPDKARRFHVNLLCSEEEGAEAALHFNPRMDESTVVFNTKEHGVWGPEERGHGLPFQRGQPFDVLLIATEEGFKVRPCRGLGAGTHLPPVGGEAGQARGEGAAKASTELGAVSAVPAPSRGASRTGRCRDPGQASKHVVPRARGPPERLAGFRPPSLFTAPRQGAGRPGTGARPEGAVAAAPPPPSRSPLSICASGARRWAPVRAHHTPRQHSQSTRCPQPPRGPLRTRTRLEEPSPRAWPRAPWAPRSPGAGGSREARGGPGPGVTPPLVPQAVAGDAEIHHFRYRIPPARVRLLEVGGDLQLESVKVF
ncbi:hypothetical protein QTO34_010425 [Cnephaeus nilssonii]|uniref:Galectin n=1 Tax=Cnephaeus nilssonii TaxID=3371016 RepID=A0AA40LG00_CNENI|nr:hypothetical protein QTO34_010425 [Eptesicus nilssonii]